MALTVGIVGLPNAGKSILFDALARNSMLVANYPSATIEPNVDMMEAPDSRSPVLARMLDSQRIVPATVSFVDTAGTVQGASEGKGMDNAFPVNIRETDAICQVTRIFENVDVTHVNGKVDSAGDIDTITMELTLADLQSLEKALPRAEKEAWIKRESRSKLETMQVVVEVLESGKRIHGSGLDMELLWDLFLLTAKSFLYVFNCDQGKLADEDLKDRMHRIAAPAKTIFLDAKFEVELVEMDGKEDRAFLEETGTMELDLDVLARVGYETPDL